MRLFCRICGWICVCFLLSSCAVTTETHPSKVSAGDLWLGQERLDAFLDARRKELDNLQETASNLTLQLKSKEKELDHANADLRKTTTRDSIQKQKIVSISREIEEKKIELKLAVEELERLKNEMAALKKSLSEKNKEKERLVLEKIAGYEIEIEDLSNDVVIIEQAIDRILLVRVRHGLETE